MRLTRLAAEGFRSLKCLEVHFEQLTVLIGENDAGKSSVLDLLDLCLSQKQPDNSDFFTDETEIAVDAIEADLEFRLDEDDAEAEPFAVKGNLKLKWVWNRNGAPSTRFYWGETPIDPRLRQDFDKMAAPAQKDLIIELDPTVSTSDMSNAEKRVAWLTQCCANAPKQEEWIPLPARLPDVLPRFERYNALDYNAPENMIAKTLKQVYEQAIYEDETRPDGTTGRRLVKPLQDVQVLAAQHIQQEVGKLRSYITKYNRRVQDVRYEPRFNFANSLVTGDFQVNAGHGLHVLTKTGAGTRRRMLMGIMDWDREVSLEQARANRKVPWIIRGYDEPDTNLHYEAQRVMYQAIADIAQSPNSRIQAILCTHSLPMIDRAPTKSIRLFRLADDGCTQLTYLETDDDPEVEHFLEDMARELGITNSLLFYERCFILIEGETEENALPILYRKQFGRSILEDGIRIINVNGNGAVKEFLKLLSRNRKQMTIVFVDRDTKGQKSAKLTAEVLQGAGFDEAFIGERLVYVGDREFEDCFSDEMIIACLQQHWPKRDDAVWSVDEIRQLRNSGKFSDGIKKLVWDCCDERGPDWSKPIFGQKLAEQCQKDYIPACVVGLFALAQSVAEI